jgi:hypothetical protein
MKLSQLLLSGILLTSYGCDSGNEKKASPKPLQKKSESRPLTSNSEDTVKPEDKVSISYEFKRRVELYDDMSNLDSFIENVNHYDLIVSTISGHYDDAVLECEKPNFNNTNSTFSTPFMNRGLIANLPVYIDGSDPSKVTFKCEVLDMGNNVLESFSASLKKSYIVQGVKHFTELIGADDVDTLVFLKGSYLKMGNLDKKIRVKNLISDNGILTSFLPNEVDDTPDNTDGMSGGVIEIDAMKAIGKLNVELCGKNGGTQTFVPPVPADKVADSKLDGKCDKASSLCNGKRGYRGEDGQDGRPGLNGGDSGRLIFKVADDKKFEVVIKYFPGKGSEGGDAGLPGKGSPGGKAATYSDHDLCGETRLCLRVRSGTPGAHGLDGNPGKKGAHGKTGRVRSSFYIANDKHQKVSIHPKNVDSESWSNKIGTIIQDYSTTDSEY